MQQITSNRTIALTAMALLTAMVLLASCAVTAPEGGAPQTAGAGVVVAPEVKFPPYSGPKTRLAVLPLGLSERAAKRYPHLLDSSVGMGVHNVLTDALHRSARYSFVEIKESVVKEAFRQQWLSASGAMDESTALKEGRMLGAQKVIYGEVYDYAEGKKEKVKGLRVETATWVRVGIQLRIVDLETLQFVPATAQATGSDWGQASQQAIDKAVLKLVR